MIAALKSRRHWASAAFLATLLLLALSITARLAAVHHRGVAMQKDAAAAALSTASLFSGRAAQVSLGEMGGMVGGIVGGVPGGVGAALIGGERAKASARVENFTVASPPDRQIVRIGEIRIVASQPSRAAEQVRALASAADGFVQQSSLQRAGAHDSAQVTVAIPAARFDQIRDQVRRLATRVEEDTVEARDVTRDSLNQDARLRNDRAEEAQYLAILRRAAAVKDVLEVSSRLAEVRGRIEEREADQRYLRQQVALSVLTVQIAAEARESGWAIAWRPASQLRLATREGLQGLADFAYTIISLLMYVPVVALWTLLLFALAKVGWLALKTLARVFFPGLPWWKRAEA